MISFLIALVVLGIAMALLYRILQKILPMLGVDGDWTSIILGIIGLAMLVAILNLFGYGIPMLR